MSFKFDQIIFSSNFDSGNLANVYKVEKTVPRKSEFETTQAQACPDYEFNLWTSPDAAGTPFVNPNRSWFYFSVTGVTPNKQIKFNIMNMNKQGKLYGQGYAPLFKTKSVNRERDRWERVKDKISYETMGTDLILTFCHLFTTESQATTYFAFSYPWSYTDCQLKLEALDLKYSLGDYLVSLRPNVIYYHRELLLHSKDGLRVDLITVSNYLRITDFEEPRFDDHLFPNKNERRCRMFSNKKVFFVSCRVHPGETPSSHVFNGFLDFILRKNDPRAEELRNRYVFKLIPILNPDGVKRGHYRTDQFGVNLNRVYLDPTFTFYPSIYAVKSLLAFYHIDCNLMIWKRLRYSHTNDDLKIGRDDLISDATTKSESDSIEPKVGILNKSIQQPPSSDMHDNNMIDSSQQQIRLLLLTNSLPSQNTTSDCAGPSNNNDLKTFFATSNTDRSLSTTPHLCHPFYLTIPPEKSGLAYYIDLHAHASKKGCFFYGNHFDDIEKQVQCRMYAKLVSLNTGHLDFEGCNFTERNMYAPDKRENISKEGSGRVAIFKHLGIVHSYTLECNYNTGRLTNIIPQACGDNGRATPPPATGILPQKFTISHFEEVGRALGIAALDMEEANPWTRITRSEFMLLSGVRDYVRKQLSLECSVGSANQTYMNPTENSCSHAVKGEKMSETKTLQYSQATARKFNKHSNNRLPIKMNPVNFNHQLTDISTSPISKGTINPKTKLVAKNNGKKPLPPKSVHPKS